MSNFELERELRQLDNERKLSKKTLDSKREQMAEMLKGSMGEDIKDVLSGKRAVKLSLYERFKYKINYYIDKIFKTI